MTNSIYCSKCKKENEVSANFCIFCGNQLLSSSTKRHSSIPSNIRQIQNQSIGSLLNQFYQWIKANSMLVTVGVVLITFFAIGSQYNFAKIIRTKTRDDPRNYSRNLQEKPAELCDRMAILGRCNDMILSNESRSCINLSNRFFESCGEYDQLHNYRNVAARRLSEWTIAMDSANKLVELYPLGATPHFIRAQTYSEMGDFASAINEYEQTLALMPDEIQTPFELANLYQRINQPCEGIPPLEQYAYLHPDEAQNAENLLSVLYKNPQCAEMQGKGKGKAKIKMKKQGTAIFSKVTINNQQQGTFIVDTGATLVTLSKSFAVRLGLNYAGWPKMLTQTANGIGVAYRGYIDSISIQGLQARHIEIAITEEIGAADGLLGLSFLNRFKIEMDSNSGYMILTARSG
jgi:aspartyl protease family protein